MHQRALIKAGSQLVAFVPLWHHSWMCSIHCNISVLSNVASVGCTCICSSVTLKFNLLGPLWHYNCDVFLPLRHDSLMYLFHCDITIGCVPSPVKSELHVFVPLWHYCWICSVHCNMDCVHWFQPFKDISKIGIW